MVFSSLEFIVFFILFYSLYYFSNDRYKIPLLIIASMIFYAFWKISYIFLPILLILIAFYGTLWISKKTGREKKKRLILIIVFLVIPLIFYKYTNFIIKDFFGLFYNFKDLNIPSIDLPLGISFITFTLIAYVVDIYTGKYKIVNKIKITTVYTLFFPHLIAGPIMRPKELIPQFENYSFSKAMFNFGLLVFAFGLLKKVVFADQLGLSVEYVYNLENTISKLDYLIAFYSFPIQIYCDFSGYTDMAIGLALMLGIKFPNNFNRPYLSVSFIDFWRRWHITLSNWIKDYIYIPLGGNKKGFIFQSKNILITMGIAGLWHGASWTFVLWGLYHGIFIVINHITSKYILVDIIKKIPKWFKILITFHLVSIGWILFRADDIDEFYRIIDGVFTNPINIEISNILINLNYLILIFIFFIIHKYDTISRVKLLYIKLDKKFIYIIIGVIFIFSSLLGTGNSAEFIYYDF